MFTLSLKKRREKFVGGFRENRKKYISIGLVSIFVFLTIFYLGPFGELGRLGLIGQKKQQEQPSHAANSTNTSYNLGVLVIKYFPLTSNGQNIDIGVTGDVGDDYTTIRQRTIDITNNLQADLGKASSYL